ncbi:MAG: ferritin-like domain-containing protein [Acidimicrobiia bacterium]
MSRVPNPTLGRRALLRNGALTVSVGALAAACGDRTGSVDPGRLGVADEADELTEEPVDDLVLLRTAQSLEYTAIEVYGTVAASDALSADERALAERFSADHQREADILGEVVAGLGGEPFTCTNPFLHDRAVLPLLEAVEGSDDLRRDLLNIAYSFEQLLGASHQSLVPLLEDKALRVAAMTIGSESLRHAAALALALDDGAVFNPALSGGTEEADERGIAVRYAVPSIFGQVSGIDVTVGAVNDEGSRFSTQLQTPAANSLIYSDTPC